MEKITSLDTKTKKCSKCRVVKELGEFYKADRGIGGVRRDCKKCNNERSKIWRKNNPEKVKEYKKDWYKNNPGKVREMNKRAYKKNIDKIKVDVKKWQNNNPEKVKMYSKRSKIKNYGKYKEYNRRYTEEYRKLNPEKAKESSDNWRKNNPEKAKESRDNWRNNNPEKAKESKRKSDKRYYEKNKNGSIKEYKLKNKEKKNERDKEYRKKRKSTDIQFKLKTNIRSFISSRLKKRLISKGGKSTFDFVPWTVEELIIHLEKQFEPWMNRENYGGVAGKWCIDHIIPDSSFNYKDVEDEEFQKCWALDNLQPMEFIENIKKSNKIIY